MSFLDKRKVNKQLKEEAKQTKLNPRFFPNVISFNFLAFLLGPFYFLFTKMYDEAILYLIAVIAGSIAILIIPESIADMLFMALASSLLLMGTQLIYDGKILKNNWKFFESTKKERANIDTFVCKNCHTEFEFDNETKKEYITNGKITFYCPYCDHKHKKKNNFEFKWWQWPIYIWGLMLCMLNIIFWIFAIIAHHKYNKNEIFLNFDFHKRVYIGGIITTYFIIIIILIEQLISYL